MADTIEAVMMSVDGRPLAAHSGMTVAAALANADLLCTRRSIGGEARFALCGMGVCQECRVTIDGQPHRLACQCFCRDGMRIATGAAAA